MKTLPPEMLSNVSAGINSNACCMLLFFGTMTLSTATAGAFSGGLIVSTYNWMIGETNEITPLMAGGLVTGFLVGASIPAILAYGVTR